MIVINTQLSTFNNVVVRIITAATVIYKIKDINRSLNSETVIEKLCK